MRKNLRNDRNHVHPALTKIILGGMCILITAGILVSYYIDRQKDLAYQEWARSENSKAYDITTHQRSTERQLQKVRKQLNDSFYQRLEDELPVRILVLGDAYGAGFGASSKSYTWSKLLANRLKLTYGVNVELDNVSLSGMNSAYSAWSQLMSQPEGTSAEVLTKAGAVRDEKGSYTGMGAGDTPISNKVIKDHREQEYDLCIISLGLSDEPALFDIYYESLLHNLRSRYTKCSVITLLSNQAVTSPHAGYADENSEAMYAISEHYHADVINVGLEMTDPDAALKGATMSELQYGSLTSQELGDDMRADGIAENKVSQVVSKDLSERMEKAERNISQYTIDGLYLSNKGQEFLADTIFSHIKKDVKAYKGYDAKTVEPILKDVVSLENYNYFPASKLSRIDDFTYVLPKALVVSSSVSEGSDKSDMSSESEVSATPSNLGKSDMSNGSKQSGESEGSGNTDSDKSVNSGKSESSYVHGIVGIDYAVLPGENDLYGAVKDGTVGFGRIKWSYGGSDSERHILPLNAHYDPKENGNLYLAFATRKQADTLHGVIVGGDFSFPPHFDDYDKVPVIGPVDEKGNPVPLDENGKVIS